jgi:hypothetical protein
MSNDNKKGPGGHYSGTNPIPNIQKFVESLDKDKKERDARLEQQMQAKQPIVSDAKDHTASQPHGKKSTRKVATDPTTEKDVEIEDVNSDFMKAVENPQVSAKYTVANQAYIS